MAWTIKNLTDKLDKLEGKTTISSFYVLEGGGNFPLAILAEHAEKNIAVFEVVFPLDEEDVKDALVELRKESKTRMEVVVIDDITHDDTGLRLLEQEEMESLGYIFKKQN